MFSIDTIIEEISATPSWGVFALLVKYSLKNDTNCTDNGEYVTNKSSEIGRSQVVYVKCK